MSLTLLLLLSSTLLDDQLIKFELLRRSLQNSLFHRILLVSMNSTLVVSFTYSSDESENVNLLGLTDTMRSIHGLQICLRVPERQHLNTYNRPTDQSESNSTTMSAVTRLIPRPPARVVSKKTNFSLSGAL